MKQLEVNEMFKEIESVAGRTLFSHRYTYRGNREKENGPATLQYIASNEQIDQCCKMEWRDSYEQESFVTHMVNKLCT
jgi:hypothetical protein